MNTKKLILFVVLSIITTSTGADDKKIQDYYDNKIKSISDECGKLSASEIINCYIERTPKRCKQIVIQSGKPDMIWARCIFTCGATNFYERHFGECSD